ncbi:DUF1501 domain-containing protein [Inhella proteolytica]|uniref:DUF1501 domain-containing protein n=1 Tax=Inhella proteolytica TaxID=2795029 RepID=A0A931IXI2_9BURK|nr:DUF1501 domain-containing protein [Inhella proteolytica]MBH9575544.1 DUF1501 domain-containing protein [Inhella proteolytica]
MKRRHLLQLGASAALTPWPALQALAQAAPPAGDYKALVCLFLFGGNDGNNLLVPTDARWAGYQRARPNLALAQASLLPLQFRNTSGQSYGLHSAMPGLQGLVNRGEAAFVANIGPLLVPTSKAQFQARSVPLPYNLYSHSDQQLGWQSAMVEAPGRHGWGGRLLERTVAAGSSNRGYASISVAGSNLWQGGDQGLTPYRVSSNGQFGLDFYNPSGSDPLSQAVSATLAEARQDPFEQTWLQVLGRSIENQRVLASALQASTLTTPFPDTGLGRQLGTVARLIKARTTLGLSRQSFFASIGGFDTHGDDQLQRQNELFGEIDGAVTAFHAALTELGLTRQVALFSASDFGRNLPSNGAGTDHGWGNHQFLLGGPTPGGRLLGRFPELVVGGPDDAGQGVWIPSTATEQLGRELAQWFGADADMLAATFPHGAAFDRMQGWE